MTLKMTWIFFFFFFFFFIEDGIWVTPHQLLWFDSVLKLTISFHSSISSVFCSKPSSHAHQTFGVSNILIFSSSNAWLSCHVAAQTDIWGGSAMHFGFGDDRFIHPLNKYQESFNFSACANRMYGKSSSDQLPNFDQALRLQSGVSSHYNLGYSSLFQRFVIPKVRLIRRFVILKVCYSEGSLFRRSVIPKVR